MADLRARLKEIETATPPDLWAGIEARAAEEVPEMDGTNVVAFRKDGSEWRRRAATALVAAAVFVIGFVVVWRAFQPAPTVAPPGTPLPDGWVRCTNNVLGYSIGYPGDWYTTDVLNGQPDPSYACMWFSPTPFPPEGNVVLEGWGYPLEVREGGPFSVVPQQQLDPESFQVLTQEQLRVDGHHALRLEYRTLNDVVGEPGLHYEYQIRLDDDSTIIVHTTETRGIVGDYEENKAIVDQAVETLEIDDPTTVSSPAGWQRCTNTELGFSLAYPGDWFTTDVYLGEHRPQDACRIFAAVPFELETGTGEPYGFPSEEGCGYPVCVRPVPMPVEAVARSLSDPERGEVLSSTSLVIRGRPAMRLDRVSSGTLGEPPGPLYHYIVELDDDTVLLFTTEGRDTIVGRGDQTQQVNRAEDYEMNRAILDRMVRTLVPTSG